MTKMAFLSQKHAVLRGRVGGYGGHFELTARAYIATHPAHDIRVSVHFKPAVLYHKTR
jgi:hypothetical protein